MKKFLFLISLAIIFTVSGCQKQALKCKIIYPVDGATISYKKDLVVKVEANDIKGTVKNVTFFCHPEEMHSIMFTPQIITEKPYSVTFPFPLPLGKLTIKAVATNDNGEQTEAIITVNVIVTSDGSKESPDFVTFSDGNWPVGWISYSWELEDKVGYSDNYSIRSANSVALVFTNKTIKTKSYVEFYTKGGTVNLLIDDVKAQAFSSEPAEHDWTKWIYFVDTGKHVFQWRAEGVYKYLDDVKFTAKP